MEVGKYMRSEALGEEREKEEGILKTHADFHEHVLRYFEDDDDVLMY